MIFYFSATGNSLWAAHELSRAFDEPMYSIPEELNKTAGELLYSVGENEKVFFVYPVHTWGHCEQICPTQTIRLQNGKPEWANTCIQCCACIHRCPVQAIEYGKITLRKGRYHHPDIK